MRCATSGCWRRCPTCSSRSAGPVVVKPARGGSALGIRLARDADEVSVALSVALAYDREAIVERFVDGRDLAVSLIELDGALVAAAGRRGTPARAELLRLRGALHARGDRLRRAGGSGARGGGRGPAPGGRRLRAARAARARPHRPDARRRRRAVAARGERGAGHDRHEPAAARGRGRGHGLRRARRVDPRGEPSAQLTSPLATRASAELSSSPWPVATSRSSCSATSRVTAIGRPWRSASASAILRSLRCSAIRNPSGYSSRITFCERFWRIHEPAAPPRERRDELARAAGPRARPARAPRRAPRRCRRSAPG